MNPYDALIEKYECQGPAMVVFDITNVCNLSCCHCPHQEQVRKSTYRPHYLSQELFRKAIREIAEWDCTCVRLTGDGEPLLHPHIREMIEWYYSVATIPLVITTNGTMLNETMSRALLSVNVHVIDISLDALFKDSYQRIRGDRYEDVMKNVFSLIAMRKEMNSKTHIMVNAIRRDENTEEMVLFERFWKPLVDFVALRTMHRAGGKLSGVGIRSSHEPSSRYPCPHLWKRITVDYEGGVSFCAHDWDHRMRIGTLEHDALSDLWHSQRMGEIRRAHRHNIYPSETPCAACTDWASSQWDYGYERIIAALCKESEHR